MASWAGIENRYADRLNELAGVAKAHSFADDIAEIQELARKTPNARKSALDPLVAKVCSTAVALDDVKDVFTAMRARRSIDTPSESERLIDASRIDLTRDLVVSERAKRTHAGYFEWLALQRAREGAPVEAQFLLQEAMTREGSATRIMRAMLITPPDTAPREIRLLCRMLGTVGLSGANQILHARMLQYLGMSTLSSRLYLDHVAPWRRGDDGGLHIVEEGYKGFNILWWRGRYIGVRQSLGMVTIGSDGRPKLAGRRASSMHTILARAIRRRIAREWPRFAASPLARVPVYGRFVFWGVRRGLRLIPRAWRSLKGKRRMAAAGISTRDSISPFLEAFELASLKRRIDDLVD